MTIRYTNIIIAATFVTACDSGSNPAQPDENLAPTVSAIADRSIVANMQSEPIGFTVSDERVGQLDIAVMSDNQSVVPDDGLVPGGDGSSRTITVTPTPDMLGDAFVTIIVTDTGGLSASSAFLLTITPEQQSIREFTRSAFSQSADGEPRPVNAVEFVQDVDSDDFADLLAQ